QLDVEHQRRVGRDHAADATLAIGHLRGDAQLAPAAFAHARHALLPAGDHLAATQREGEGLVAVVRTVELLAAQVRLALVVDPAGVVHRDLVARLRDRALALLHVDPLQLRHAAAGRRPRVPAAGEKRCAQHGGEEDPEGGVRHGRLHRGVAAGYTACPAAWAEAQAHWKL